MRCVTRTVDSPVQIYGCDQMMKPNSWGVWCVYKSKKSPPLACKHNPKELLLAWCNIKRCVFSSRVVKYIIIVIRFVSQCLLETNETQLYVIICFCGVWDSGRSELPDSLSSERFRNNSIFKLTSTTIAHTMVWDLIKHAILKTLVPKVAHCFCNRHEWNSSDFHLCIFIQRDLQCIQVIHLLSVCVFPGNWTHDLCAANAMLYHWATGTFNLHWKRDPGRI